MKQAMKHIRIEKKDVPVYEHLEHSVRNTNYTHRWLWFQQVNEWFYLLEKKKIIPARKRPAK